MEFFGIPLCDFLVKQMFVYRHMLIVMPSKALARSCWYKTSVGRKRPLSLILEVEITRFAVPISKKTKMMELVIEDDQWFSVVSEGIWRRVTGRALPQRLKMGTLSLTLSPVWFDLGQNFEPHILREMNVLVLMMSTVTFFLLLCSRMIPRILG